jgi:hypothetical protein
MEHQVEVLAAAARIEELEAALTASRAEARGLIKQRDKLKRRHEEQKATSRRLRSWGRGLAAELAQREDREDREDRDSVFLQVRWNAARHQRRAEVFLRALRLLEGEAVKREWPTIDGVNKRLWSLRREAEAIDRERFRPEHGGCTCVPARADVLLRALA